jgi:hypothetical protein
MGTEGEDDDEDSIGMKTSYVPAPIRVTSTISRYSIGTTHYDVFDPSRHSRSDPDYVWSADEGDYVITNQMRWYIRKVRRLSHHEMKQ